MEMEVLDGRGEGESHDWEERPIAKQERRMEIEILDRLQSGRNDKVRCLPGEDDGFKTR
jgi:hypothetical protein